MAVAVWGSTWSPVNALFRQFEADVHRQPAARRFVPAADVAKDGNDLVVTLALPGVDVDKDVDVTVTEGRLTITGRHADTNGAESNGVLSREIHTGGFRRQFAIPRDVTAERVEADYDKGLLKVRVREVVRAAVEPAKIQIRSTAPALESTEAK
ncbi:MAG TPA: Hsp20/alpha crystallin family protein [Pseudonocardiaceae bacterium]